MREAAPGKFDLEAVLQLRPGPVQGRFGRGTKVSGCGGLSMESFLGFVTTPWDCAHAAHRDAYEIDVAAALLDDYGSRGQREFVRRAVTEFEVEALRSWR